jgi:hypothetical protein
MNLRILLSSIAGFACGAAWGATVAYLGGAAVGELGMGVCTLLGSCVGAVVCGLFAENWTPPQK